MGSVSFYKGRRRDEDWILDLKFYMQKGSMNANTKKMLFASAFAPQWLVLR